MPLVVTEVPVVVEEAPSALIQAVATADSAVAQERLTQAVEGEVVVLVPEQMVREPQNPAEQDLQSLNTGNLPSD